MRGPRPLGCWREGNRTNKVSVPPPAGSFDGSGHIFGYGPNKDPRAVRGSQLGTGSGGLAVGMAICSGATPMARGRGGKYQLLS